MDSALPLQEAQQGFHPQQDPRYLLLWMVNCISHDKMLGNVRYYTTNKDNTPAVRYRFKINFPKKLLVWIVISDKGLSEPFFVPIRGSLNGEIYRRECIESRLVSFLEEHHFNGDYWPDLAGSHYANATQELLHERNVKNVPKDSNPPTHLSFVQSKTFGESS